MPYDLLPAYNEDLAKAKFLTEKKAEDLLNTVNQIKTDDLKISRKKTIKTVKETLAPSIIQ
ncbi:MAG: hypothetical protein JWM09_1166 [Francisellaceae bacterium]|nr:hypothetical protein [Francisellaceae bacterium]